VVQESRRLSPYRDRRRPSIKTGELARAFTVTAVGVVILWSLYEVRDVLLIIYVSVLLAIGFGPIVRAIEHQKIVRIGTGRLPRWLAILLVYGLIVATLAEVGLLIVPPLIDQAQELWKQLPSLVERAQTRLIDFGLLDHPLTLEEAVRSGPAPSNAVGTVATAVTRVFSGMFGFITILILTFYLLVEAESLMSGFARLFPRGERPRVEEASRKISAKVSAWLSGQLILASTIGASAAIGLFLLNVPYFYVLALVAAIGELIPIVGPIVSAVPAVIVAFTVSTQTGVLVLVFFLLQQQVENHLLVPKVMERQVGVSPVIVVVALLLGGALLGIVGALLAVPTAAILQVVVQELLDERDRVEV
jgi:predicted PurR-regulated permease PerM